jgi:hypothetical protein
MRGIAGTVILGCALALAACSASSDSENKEEDIKAARADAVTKAVNDEKYKPPKPICPQVAIIHELENVRDYGGEKPDPDRLVSEGKLINIEGSCEYQDTGVDIAFTLHMAARRGPRLGSNRVDFPFFIAVVDPDQNILNKDQMTASFQFDEDKRTAAHDEPLHVFLPLAKAKDQDGPNYQVLLGFQLNEGQLKDVREREGVEEKN